MKIALVVPGGVDRSGEYRVIPTLLALIKRLATRHALHVFAMRQEMERSQWPLLGATVHNIGGRCSPLRVPRAVAAIVQEHRRGEFDVLQSLWSGDCGLTAVLAARLIRAPSFVHVTGGELVALPSIGYGGQMGWRGRLREALVLRRATALSGTSESILEQFAALGLSARRVPLGVDLQAFEPCAPKVRPGEQRLRLIHVASLNRVKDQSTLLQALALLARQGCDFEIDVIGEDTLDGQVQTLAAHLGLTPRIRFHGFMTQQALRPLFAQAHINLISSLHEAGPLVVLEAAVLGVPSVGTSVGHLREWSPDAAIAVPVSDAVALAAAVRRLGDDEALRLRMAQAAQRLAMTEDADHTAALFERMHSEWTQAAR